MMSQKQIEQSQNSKQLMYKKTLQLPGSDRLFSPLAASHCRVN